MVLYSSTKLRVFQPLTNIQSLKRFGLDFNTLQIKVTGNFHKMTTFSERFKVCHTVQENWFGISRSNLAIWKLLPIFIHLIDSL